MKNKHIVTELYSRPIRISYHDPLDMNLAPPYKKVENKPSCCVGVTRNWADEIVCGMDNSASRYSGNACPRESFFHGNAAKSTWSSVLKKGQGHGCRLEGAT